MTPDRMALPRRCASTVAAALPVLERIPQSLIALLGRCSIAAGLGLPPTQLLIFGNPKAGTPLMQAAPTIGLDLPMKVLVWQDAQGQVQVAWNSPDYLIQRHGLEATATASLAPISGLVDAALK